MIKYHWSRKNIHEVIEYIKERNEKIEKGDFYYNYDLIHSKDYEMNSVVTSLRSEKNPR
jgi:erythromycin esterase-like protein